MPKLVYFSSVSENTHRFVQRLGLPADRIPLRRTEEPLVADEEYVLVVPTYGFGKGTGAVPKQVIAFLNDEHNRSLCRGVIAAGNTNFGEAYCIAGDIISAKLQVPYLYRFELLGTRGLAPLVLEAGDSAGAAIREWSHVRLFSPWQYDVDAAARRLLTPTGWEAPPPTRLPTGADLVSDYLEPLAGTAALRDRIVTGARVTAVSRAGMDKTHGAGRADRPFLVRSVIGGEVVDHVARAVVDASGTWRHRNPLGVAGLPAPGEDEAVPYLLGPLPDVLGVNRGRVAGRHVLVVGSGHSAANTLLSLVELARTAPGTRVTWAVRGASVTRAYGGGDADGLPARGMLGARLRSTVEAGEVELLTGATITRIARHDDGLTVTLTGERELHVHAIAGATGFRPDLDLLRELRLELDPALEAPRLLAPLIDPEHHSCGTVPAHGADTLAHPAEPGFFVVGAKSYGRAPTFLLATGYEQVRSVAAHLAGDDDAARDLRLNLPETGVCSSAPPLADEEGHAVVDPAGGCCGPSDEPELIGVPTGLRHGRAGGELRA